MLTIEARALGKKQPLVPDWSVQPPADLPAGGASLTLHALISRIVHAEAEAFRQRQEERRLIHVLSRAQIADGVAQGKVAMGGEATGLLPARAGHRAKEQGTSAANTAIGVQGAVLAARFPSQGRSRGGPILLLQSWKRGERDTMQRRICIPLMALAAVLALAAGTVRSAQAQGAQAFPQPGGAVLVAWLAVPNPAVVGYNVYRAEVGVAVDKAVLVNPQPTTGTTLLDTGPNGNGLPLGKPLNYYVRALYKDAAGKLSEGSTGPAVVTPQNPTVIPAGSFFYYDIATPFPGSVTVEGNVLTIRASGDDLWDGNDGQTFLAMPVTGNYQITARLNEQPTLVDPEAGNPWAKIGVQIRSGLARGDQFAVAYASVERDPEVMYEGHKSFFRGLDNFSHGGTGLSDTTFPVYLRLVKQGATVTAFQSFDDKSYTQIGDAQDYGSLPPVTYVGIVLGSSRPGQYAIGKFAADSIKIEPK